MDISIKMDRCMAMVDLAAEKTFKVVEYILEKKQFTQYSAKKELKVGMSTVNNLFSYLLEKGFIEKKEDKYVLTDPVSLIESVSFFRSMKDCLILEFSTSLEKTELEKKLPIDAVFCMESALAQYSNYYKTNVVSIYLPKNKLGELKKMLGVGFGNTSILKVFEPKLAVTKTVKLNGKLYTPQARTLIDLACDKKGAMGDKLIEHLFKVKIHA